MLSVKCVAGESCLGISEMVYKDENWENDLLGGEIYGRGYE